MLDAAREGSTAVRWYESLAERADAVLEASGLRPAAATIGRFVRASYCYRWLTAEPEPDVIVIDLRDAYTVGPFIRLLEETNDVLAAGYANSRLEPVVSTATEALRTRPIRALGGIGLPSVAASLLVVALLGSPSTALVAAHFVAAVLSAVALRSTRSLSELLESRPIAVLAAVLEPPEPPDSRRDSGTDESRTASETEPQEESAAAEPTNDENET